MKKLIGLFNELLKGGIFFLFPIILVIIFLEKAISLLSPLATSITEHFGDKFFITSSPYLLSIIILVFICLVAGYIASKGVGLKMVNWIENNILTLFPGYHLMKNTLQDTAGLSAETSFPVVLAPIDGWMLGFEVDKLDNGDLVIFVPGAPNIWEGNVIIFEEKRIKRTNLHQKDVQKIMRQLGVNSQTILNQLEKNQK